MRCSVGVVLVVSVVVAGCASRGVSEPAGSGAAQEGVAPAGGEAGRESGGVGEPADGDACQRAEGVRQGALGEADVCPEAPAGGAGSSGTAELPSGEGAASDAPEAGGEARAWAGCAVVHLGFDLRALRHGTRGNGVDMYVRSRADDLAQLAGEPTMRMAHIPGTGVMWGYFDAVDTDSAVGRCEGAVTRYLQDPPRLPILMEPAVTVVQPCRPCDAPTDAAP